MDPGQESKSLRADPLPDEKSLIVFQPGDETLPSQIYQLDQEYQKLVFDFETATQKNRDRRAELLNRAVALKTYTCGEIYLHKKTKNLPREVNKDALKKWDAEMLTRAIQSQKDAAMAAIQTQIDNLDTAADKILIKTLKELGMEDTEIDEVCFPHKFTESWEVKKRKAKPLPAPKEVS